VELAVADKSKNYDVFILVGQCRRVTACCLNIRGIQGTSTPFSSLIIEAVDCTESLVFNVQPNGAICQKALCIFMVVIKRICPVSFRETCQWLKMSPEWVTGPEQGKSSGRVATFSLWTGLLRDGISSIPDETVIPL